MVTYKYRVKVGYIVCLLFLLGFQPTVLFSQFFDSFDKNLQLDDKGLNGWTCLTGDGQAKINISKVPQSMLIRVDATNDKRGIWWAVIKHNISSYIDLKKIGKPGYELRIEARIKVSHAPRRVNLSIYTPIKTDLHPNLMEFDIPDTSNFHTISYTTKAFSTPFKDQIHAQMALMDWGLDTYEVLVDYFKVEMVESKTAAPDVGVQVPYHPPIEKVETFGEHLMATEDAMINPLYPDQNFNAWYALHEGNKVEIVSVSDCQYIILKWDLTQFKGKTVVGSGLLSLVTHSVQRSSDFQKDFGMIRVSEIIGGDLPWTQNSVTYNSFCGSQPLCRVINSQMIIDTKVEEKTGNNNYITISQPVLQRLIDGKTKGIAILPLGAVQATFFATEYGNKAFAAQLHFNYK